MTRMTPFIAASALVAILTLGAGAASAAAVGNNGGHPSGPGPSGPSGTSGGATLPRAANCSVRADQMNLAGAAWQTFVNHCQQTGG